jgi:ribonuclease BN (tRNA processing enzyme)
LTELVFLGTKGEIEESSPKHAYHSSLLLRHEGVSLLIDYGVLHKFRPEEISPSAILVTHAHPDHYVWLKEDIETVIPVYLTMETLEYGKFKPENQKVIAPGEKFEIGSVECLAYRVIHSIRCPAVGYKLKIDQKTLVYNSDLVDIIDKDSVLTGVDYYIGDGSGIRANLVRRRGNQLFGHTRIITQINWCKKYGINHIIFTHLGKETIEKEAEFKQEHPDISLAYDGMELRLS